MIVLVTKYVFEFDAGHGIGCQKILILHSERFTIDWFKFWRRWRHGRSLRAKIGIVVLVSILRLHLYQVFIFN